MLHTSVVPTILTAGYRYNVIPSEAKATLDVRLHPDEDQSKFLDQIRAVIHDPSVEVRWARERYRPAGASRLNTELFAAIEAETKKHYNVDVLPTMSTGASDKAQIRSKGVQCYGIGPALDTEDGAKGFGAHSDQERILEVGASPLRAVPVRPGDGRGACEVTGLTARANHRCQPVATELRRVEPVGGRPRTIALRSGLVRR